MNNGITSVNYIITMNHQKAFHFRFDFWKNDFCYDESKNYNSATEVWNSKKSKFQTLNGPPISIHQVLSSGQREPNVSD